MKPQWPILGNESFGQMALELLDRDRWPTASLWVGLSGLGKEAAARWLAQVDVCTGESRPCGSCENCRQFLAGTHPRVAILSGEPGETLKIEEVREVLDRFRYVFDERAWLIIPDADRLTEAAQNILLKFLEEPPSYVMSVMTTARLDAIRPTVQSRVSIFRWSRVPDKQLRQHYPTASVLDLSAADGRPGRLIRLLSDDGRQNRRQQAVQQLTAVAPVWPGEQEEDEVAQMYETETVVLRQWLHQATGIEASTTPQPWSLDRILGRLEAYLERHDRSWANVAPRTLYAHLHLV